MILGKYFSIWLLLLLVSIDPGDIAAINELKKKAQEAYEDKDYVTAAFNYQVLIDSMGVTDPEIKLNLAHCYFTLDNETDALNYYKNLCAEDVDEALRSVAYQQLGVINANKNDLKNALEDFKASLRANPNNEDARYNYEVVKRKLKEEEEKKEKQKQDQQKQDQEQKKEDQQQDDKNEQSDQENKQQQQEQEQKDKEKQEQEQEENQEQKEQQQSEDEKQKEQKEQQQTQNPEIDRARAEQILKSMQEQEKQYFQQLKKKGKKKGGSGPDW